MDKTANDVLIAIIGGSLSIAGILLVFMGFVYSQAQSFPIETSNAIVGRYKVVAKAGLVPFLVAVADGAMSLRGLQCQQQSIYVIALDLFWVEMLMLAVYGVVSVLWYLK